MILIVITACSISFYKILLNFADSRGSERGGVIWCSYILYCAVSSGQGSCLYCDWTVYL